MGVGTQRSDFAEFYRSSKDECLFTVLVSVGDQDTAQELVAEAFARAWASWRTVSKHPAPVAWVVRTALNANISRWRRRRREVSVSDLGTVADHYAVEGTTGDSVDPRPDCKAGSARTASRPASTSPASGTSHVSVTPRA